MEEYDLHITIVCKTDFSKLFSDSEPVFEFIAQKFLSFVLRPKILLVTNLLTYMF